MYIDIYPGHFSYRIRFYPPLEALGFVEITVATHLVQQYSLASVVGNYFGAEIIAGSRHDLLDGYRVSVKRR